MRRQRMLFFQLHDGIGLVNEALADGWMVVRWETTALAGEGPKSFVGFVLVLLEREEAER